jgi:hypothetical protein
LSRSASRTRPYDRLLDGLRQDAPLELFEVDLVFGLHLSRRAIEGQREVVVDVMLLADRRDQGLLEREEEILGVDALFSVDAVDVSDEFGVHQFLSAGARRGPAPSAASRLRPCLSAFATQYRQRQSGQS